MMSNLIEKWAWVFDHAQQGSRSRISEGREMKREYVPPAGAKVNKDYPVEKGVPLVEVQSSRHFSIYPFAEMDFMDCFKAPLDEQQRIRVQAQNHKPKKFTVRKISDKEVRVWRIK